MVRPYSNPKLHQKLVLDYAEICSKMKDGKGLMGRDGKVCYTGDTLTAQC